MASVTDFWNARHNFETPSRRVVAHPPRECLTVQRPQEGQHVQACSRSDGTTILQGMSSRIRRLSTQRDLIDMASHERKGVTALVLESLTSKVLTHSRIPVLVYRFAP